MKKIINEPSRADITFVLEGRPIHAHRCIILARCRALEEQIREKGTKSDERTRLKYGTQVPTHYQLEIPSMRYRAFLGFIEFLYTDNIQSLKNNQNEEFEIEHILDLWQLSHEFKSERLRKLCEETIEPSITIENCTIVLKRAWEIGEEAEVLKTTCLNYILLNYQHVIATSVFYDLPTHIIKEINMKVVAHGVRVNVEG